MSNGWGAFGSADALRALGAIVEQAERSALEKLELGDEVKLAPWQIDEWVAVLGEYSCSLPTGTRIGKRWMFHEGHGAPADQQPGEHEGWWVGEYQVSKLEGMVDIKWRRVVLDTEQMALAAEKRLRGEQPRGGG